MKKPHFSPMIWITCIFFAFTLGFSYGKNQSGSDLRVSVIEPSHSEVSVQADESTVPAVAETIPLLVNINTATKDELLLLPGIGEVYAQRIIDYRETHGDFTIVEDLMQVKGIKGARLEAILDMITVGGNE